MTAISSTLTRPLTLPRETITPSPASQPKGNIDISSQQLDRILQSAQDKNRSAGQETSAQPTVDAAHADAMRELTAQREIAGALIGYQDAIYSKFIGMILQSRAPGEQLDDRPYAFDKVTWNADQTTATVWFLGAKGYQRGQQVTAQRPGMHPEANFAMLKSYTEAFSAQDKKLSELPASTLQALLAAPREEESAPPGILKAQLLARTWKDAGAELVASGKLPAGNWAPTLEMQILKLNGQTRFTMTIRNLDLPENQKGAKKVVAIDKALFDKFMEVRNAIGQQLQIIEDNIDVLNGKTQPDADPLAAVNALLQLKTMQASLMSEKPQDTDYFAAIQLSMGALRTGASATSSGLEKLGWVSKSVKVARAGVVLEGVNLGLAAIEMAKAPPEKRARLIPKLVFGAIALGMGFATLAGVIGGPAGVALAVALYVLKQVVVALTNEAADTLDRMIQLGDELQAMVDKAKAGGMRYDIRQATLAPLPNVIVEELDLKAMTIKFGAAKIHGAKEVNSILNSLATDKDKEINVSERLGAVTSASLPVGSSAATTVVLPGYPNFVIDQQYGPMELIIGRNDAGLKTLDRIGGENGDFLARRGTIGMENFKYDFKPTTVKVTLGSASRRLQMPKYPNASKDYSDRHQAKTVTGMSGKISYELNADSGNFVVGLMPGAVNLRLSSAAPQTTQWTLDARELESDQVVFDKTGLSIGGVHVEIPAGQQQAKLVLIGKDGRTNTIDLAQQRRITWPAQQLSGRKLSERQLAALTQSEIGRGIASYQRYFDEDLLTHLIASGQFSRDNKVKFAGVSGPVQGQAINVFFESQDGKTYTATLRPGSPAYQWAQNYNRVVEARGQSLEQLDQATLEALKQGVERALPSDITIAPLFAQLLAVTADQRAQWIEQLLASGINGTDLPGYATLDAVANGSLTTPVASQTPALPPVKETLTQFGTEIKALDRNTKDGGMQLDAGQKTLSPLPGVVIREMDLTQGTIRFDSPDIRARTNIKGFAVSDALYQQVDMSQNEYARIDILNRLGLQKSADLPDGALSAQTVHLPSMPKYEFTYKSHNYNVPELGVTADETGTINLSKFEGKELLEKLEGDDLAIIYKPTNLVPRNILKEIEHTYQPTRVEIKLGSVPRRLQMPVLPAEMKDKLSYDLRADSGQFVVGLQSGARLMLDSAAPAQTEWKLDARELETTEVIFDEAGMTIGGVRIDIPAGQQDVKIKMICKDGSEMEIRRPARVTIPAGTPRVALPMRA